MLRKSEMWRNNVYNLWCFIAFYNILLPNHFILQFTLFCREISFGTIYALLRGDKLSQRLGSWRKNYQYDQMAPLQNLATRWCHLYQLHIWPPSGTTWIGLRFGHQVTPFTLCAKLATRLHCHIALDCPIDIIS